MRESPQRLRARRWLNGTDSRVYIQRKAFDALALVQELLAKLRKECGPTNLAPKCHAPKSFLLSSVYITQGRGYKADEH